MNTGRIAYVARRVVAALLTILVAVTLNFAIFRAAPGDAADRMSRVPGAGPELRESLKSDFGLDKPPLTQYGLYLKQLASGNLGISFADRRPVTTKVKQALGNTISMVLVGTVFAIILGVVTGVIAAVRRASALDHIVVALAAICFSLPAQWLGLMFILLFAGILPSGGREDAFLIDPTWIEHQMDLLEHMLLPALTLGLVLFGQYTLIVRSSMLETLGEDYILTARAKGLRTRAIVVQHALRNALLPTVTLIALSLGAVVGGAILVEIVFSWPGIGTAIYDAVAQRDYPMLQGAFLVITIAVVFCNLAADLLYARLDPRVSR